MTHTSRILNPTTPGGLLTMIGGLMSVNEELVLQSITSGTYFYFNITPTGTIDGSNPTFTLPVAPNPASSTEVKLNGMVLTYGTGYTLSGLILTMVNIPQVGDEFRANFTNSPV
ncbi:hypothetical protein M0R04_09950 [Candidatus Dojkabacteria bacterium]|jgi:hypothetical protein|nr:hypothetical protein [Candidatus Dojkabacteria bacterium]